MADPATEILDKFITNHPVAPVQQAGVAIDVIAFRAVGRMSAEWVTRLCEIPLRSIIDTTSNTTVCGELVEPPAWLTSPSTKLRATDFTIFGVCIRP
jgi:hypothetical protein